ncbi:MAG: 30S ribosomal protein S13 [Dehalococcoidia bacterium]|nr:30S ribosomal protein S13 [Dehalococcoidia bacterium]
MAIIAGINLPDNKRVAIALRYLFGIGPTRALVVAREAGIQGNPKMREVSDEHLARLREIIAKFKIEGDLRREVQMNIRRKIEIRSYQGIRHSRGLPVHGQRTRSNARGRKGPRKTVAGRSRAAAKK